MKIVTTVLCGLFLASGCGPEFTLLEAEDPEPEVVLVDTCGEFVPPEDVEVVRSEFIGEELPAGLDVEEAEQSDAGVGGP